MIIVQKLSIFKLTLKYLLETLEIQFKQLFQSMQSKAGGTNIRNSHKAKHVCNYLEVINRTAAHILLVC